MSWCLSCGWCSPSRGALGILCKRDVVSFLIDFEASEDAGGIRKAKCAAEGTPQASEPIGHLFGEGAWLRSDGDMRWCRVMPKRLVARIDSNELPHPFIATNSAQSLLRA
jgi:hypothetical protein